MRCWRALGWLLLFVLWVWLPNTVEAALITLSWDMVSGAASYKLYKCVPISAAACTTWTQVATTTDGTTVTMIVTVEDTTIVLLRVSAVNAGGEVIQYHQGAWYDGRLRQTPPSGLGVK